MAMLEDLLKGNVLIAIGVGATALLLPKVLPELPAPVRSVVKGGFSLFLESESEAEGGIVSRLADNALKNVLHSLSGPGSADDRNEAARKAVENFKQTARTRARRYGRDDEDRSARYCRHIAALRLRLERERSHATGVDGEALQALQSTLEQA